MSKNKSSASSEEIMPAGKPAASFMTEVSKSGEGAISVKKGTNPSGKSESLICEDYSRPVNDMMGGEETSPAGKPSKSFITNAVK